MNIVIYLIAYLTNGGISTKIVHVRDTSAYVFDPGP
jgi:hypothetical protein